MGLDSIELIIEIEKAFDISIPDHEAEKLRTVGDLHNSVWNHLVERRSSRCNSQILFYKFRSYLITAIGIERNSFISDTLLNDIFPKENRRKKYSDFQNGIHLALPKLVLTKTWNTFLYSFGVICILGSLLYALFMAEILNYTKWLYLLPVAGILLTAVVSSSLNSKRVVIYPFSVKDFTEKTLVINYSVISKDMGVNRREVENVINHIIVDKIGVGRDETSPEKSLTDDLGVD